MGYTIQYGSTGKLEGNWLSHQKKRKAHKAKWIVLSILGLALFFSLKSEAVQNFLIPGDPEVTKAAFLQFTEDIKGGEQFQNAVYTFCREIIDHADIPE